MQNLIYAYCKQRGDTGVGGVCWRWSYTYYYTTERRWFHYYYCYVLRPLVLSVLMSYVCVAPSAWRQPIPTSTAKRSLARFMCRVDAEKPSLLTPGACFPARVARPTVLYHHLLRGLLPAHTYCTRGREPTNPGRKYFVCTPHIQGSVFELSPTV